MLFYLKHTWTWKKRLRFNKIKIAEKFTKQNKEKSRYRFILGQLTKIGKKDSDLQLWVGNMNRKSERKYVIQAQARKAQLFDYQKGIQPPLLKTYKTDCWQRKQTILDVLNHQMGVFMINKTRIKKALIL
jgi:hypothetical protein